MIGLALGAGCGTGSQGALGATDGESARRPAAEATEWDLRIEVQFMVDESLSTLLELDPRFLRDFRYERRGDIGDGTEEVVRCTGALPDAEQELLRAALDLPSWKDGEPFTVSVPGGDGPEAVWTIIRQRLEGHTPVPEVPPSRAAVRAMVPSFERLLSTIREADGAWSTCTTQLER